MLNNTEIHNHLDYKGNITNQNTLTHERMFIGIDFGTTNSVLSFYDIKTSQPIILEYDNKQYIPTDIYFNSKGDEISYDSNNIKYTFKHVKGILGKSFIDIEKGIIEANNGCLTVNDRNQPIFSFEVDNKKPIKKRSQRNKTKQDQISQSEDENNIKHIIDPKDQSIYQSEDEEMKSERKCKSSSRSRSSRSKSSYESESETTKSQNPSNETKKVICKTPEEVGLITLMKMRETLKQKCNIPLEQEIECVFTIPAAYTQQQRKATIQMAKTAHFRATLIHEPTAAALYYFHSSKDILTSKERLLVFDFGGGTLDISIVDVENVNNNYKFEVLASKGNVDLGGKSFDINTFNMMKKKIDEYVEMNSYETINWISAKNFKLKKQVEQMKHHLSTNNDYRFVLDDYIKESDRDELLITLEDFNECNKQIFEDSKKLIDESLRIAKISDSSISKVLLIGGTCQVQQIKRMMIERFGEQKIVGGYEPMDAVVKGACIHAYKNCDIIDVLQTDIKMKRFDGSTITIFEENTPLPAERVISVEPEYDGQTSLEISVYEGKYSVANMNKLIDTYTFTGLSGVETEDAYIEIHFTCDKEGTLEIQLIDFNNEDENQIKQKQSMVLSKCKSLQSMIEEIVLKWEDKAKAKEFIYMSKELVEEEDIHKLLQLKGLVDKEEVNIKDLDAEVVRRFIND